MHKTTQLSSSFLKPALAALIITLATPAWSAEDFSPAERVLFMQNHLGQLKLPATLLYKYTKSGSMEPGFEDRVVLRVKAKADKTCCAAEADFLTDTRKLALPEVESAEGNPVLLYFLERDIREMQRLTKGQSNYFRKRIRMAVYQGAQIKDVSATWDGKTVPAREISIAPYTDDPLKDRFAKYVGKRYTFVLSDAVPGGLLSVSARVEGETLGAPPLWTEEITLSAVK